MMSSTMTLSSVPSAALEIAEVSPEAARSPKSLLEDASLTIPSMEAVASTLQTSVSQAAHASHEIAASIEHILHFKDLPQWMQIDPYIQQGYRRQLDSFRACFWSLFYTHNELVNTWSHLLPAFFYLALLLATDYSVFLGGAKVSTPDNLAFQTYVAGTAGCLLLSAFFHATNAHSEDVVRRFLKLDYLGITLSISVTCISSTYFGLYGDPTLQALYITMTVICASAVFRAVLDPEMDGPAAAGWRAVLFIALAGSGFTPVGHKAVTDGVDSLQGFPLFSLMLMSLSYLVGTVIYITHVPEKYWPGRFDIWGASHQIFHFMVAVGQVVYLLGLKEVLQMHYL